MKKKIIPFLVCLVLAFGFALYGCSGDSLSKIKVNGVQNTGYTVYSNGGSAVQYGNYIYFINGYSGYEDTDGKQNTWPDIVKGGLYRAELSGKQNETDKGRFDIAVNTEAATAGFEFVRSEGRDEENKPTDIVDVELIAPKRIGTSGYGEGGIFIYDEWVYFASPNNEKNKAGVVQASKTDFFRMRLDGSRAERVYTTANDSASSPYAFYKYNGAVYLVAQDGTDVVSVRMGKKAGNKVTIAKNVTSVLLPYSKTYYKGMNENTLDHFVYILRAVGEGDSQKTGNVIEIMRPDGNSGGKYLSQGKSDTLEAVRDGLLFFRTTTDAGDTRICYDSLHDFFMGENGDKAYRDYYGELSSEDPKARMQISGVILSTSSISDYTSTYCFRPDGEQSNRVYMLGAKADGIECRSNLAEQNMVYNAAAKILSVADGYVYFTDTDANVIYRTRWDMAVSGKTDVELKEQVSHDSVTATNFNGDYCAGYIVYMGKVDSVADAYTFFKKADGIVGNEPVFVGKRTEADTLAAPEIELDGREISWKAVDKASKYNVYYSRDGVTELIERGTDSTSYNITGAATGKYWVVAVTDDGAVSANSNTVNYKG